MGVASLSLRVSGWNSFCLDPGSDYADKEPLTRQLVFDAGLGPRPSSFLLLGQKKVTKEKAAPIALCIRNSAV
jgi:hypothetical protein